MNRKGLIISILIIVACLGITIFTLSLKHDKVEEVIKTDVTKSKVEVTLANLTLEEKIGQMLIVSYPGTTYTEDIATDLETYRPGGVILFSDNMSTFDNTLNLITSMEKTATIPLFMAMDQEGGKVQRLIDVSDVPVSKVPTMWDLGQTSDAPLAYDVGKLMSEELRVFHINLDFAPVLDIVPDKNSAFIGSRSFGNNPDLVSKMGLAVAQGLKDNDVIPVFKHFPGHGNTITDSHLELPILEKTKDELLKTDLLPFIKAIEAGADVIMIGHLATPNITDNNTPASLSKEIVTNLLKEELGYKGLVITDALNMKALTNYYTEQEIYEMAINAGVDILLMPNSSKSAINLIKDSLNKGTITINQIDAAVTKILTLKYSKIKTDYPTKDVIGNTEHQETIAKIK